MNKIKIFKNGPGQWDWKCLGDCATFPPKYCRNHDTQKAALGCAIDHARNYHYVRL